MAPLPRRRRWAPSRARGCWTWRRGPGWSRASSRRRTCGSSVSTRARRWWPGVSRRFANAGSTGGCGSRSGGREALPFADGSLDAVTFTYLLRYVDDPAATVAELVRVLRPGGVMASLEFHVPPEPWARAGWLAYTRSAMPLVGWTVSNEWYRTGRFLAPEHHGVRRAVPAARPGPLVAGGGDASRADQAAELGAAVVTWGVKTTPVMGDESEDSPTPMGETSDRPAFYALSPGGWRDYWTLLHPPYTVWHLSYVVIGACVAPVLNVGWLVETLLAFFLAMGLAAHALDELNGRPLRTRIPDGVLVGDRARRARRRGRARRSTVRS